MEWGPLSRRVARWGQRPWWLSGPVSVESTCPAEFYTSPVCSVSSGRVTKTHMAYYSMQGIWISLLFFLPFSALFAAILPPLVFFCLCSPFWLPVILPLILKWTTWESFFVSVLSLWDVSLKRSKLPFLSVLLFSSHLVTHQALKYSHLFVCLCKSFTPLWFLMLMWFSFLFK